MVFQKVKYEAVLRSYYIVHRFIADPPDWERQGAKPLSKQSLIA
jgi:hypothetical protein